MNVDTASIFENETYNGLFYTRKTDQREKLNGMKKIKSVALYKIMTHPLEIITEASTYNVYRKKNEKNHW